MSLTVSYYEEQTTRCPCGHGYIVRGVTRVEVNNIPGRTYYHTPYIECLHCKLLYHIEEVELPIANAKNNPFLDEPDCIAPFLVPNKRRMNLPPLTFAELGYRTLPKRLWMVLEPAPQSVGATLLTFS